jgi:hypothetical protein
MKNPYIHEDSPHEWMNGNHDDLVRKLFPEGGEAYIMRLAQSESGKIGQHVQKRLKEMGHDGLIVTPGTNPNARPEYIAFSPTQVKSALHNTGGYDSSNPRLDMSEHRALRFDYRFAGHHVGLFPLVTDLVKLRALQATGAYGGLKQKAAAAGITLVPHGNIVGTQGLVVAHQVEGLRGWSANHGGNVPTGVRNASGQVHVFDGHHRIAADWLDGHNSSPMRVADE